MGGVKVSQHEGLRFPGSRFRGLLNEYMMCICKNLDIPDGGDLHLGLTGIPHLKLAYFSQTPKFT